VPKPKAAPKITKLMFFIIVSPFSLQWPPWQFSFRWWFNEKDAQEFRIRCTRNRVGKSRLTALFLQYFNGTKQR
jgi:hypothetical protein